MEKTYYEILGITKDATPEEINNAYDKKILKTESVKEAYRILIDPSKRKEYNDKLESQREKTYYEILGVSKTATREQITIRYNSLSKNEKEKIEVSKAFDVLSDSKKRALYNIQIGKIALKKEANLKLKSDIVRTLNNTTNTYDNYTRQIYIKKYENKIDLLKKQIELIQTEKDKDRYFYRVELSNLMAQLNRASDELLKWKSGKDVVAYESQKKLKDGSYKLIEHKGKGIKATFVSSWLKRSLEGIEKSQEQIEDINNRALKKTGFKILNFYWKTVNLLSSNSIKLYSNTWSTIVHGIIINSPSIISMSKTISSSEAEFNKEVEEALTRTR